MSAIMSTTFGGFVSGGIAGCGAVTFSHSFETVKIRLQLQGELQAKGAVPKQYKGVFHGASVIVRNEGLRGLFRGIGCAYIYQIGLNGCRLGFYAPFRENVNKVLGYDAATQVMPINMMAGAMTGAMGAVAGNPFFLVKTRLQSYSPFLPVGTQHQYKNGFDGLRQIFKSEGFLGLYRGVGPAIVRTSCGSSVQLPSYFFAKRNLKQYAGMEEGTPLHLTSSAMAGVIVCVVMHPPDTIMSRMYNQTGNLYSGAFDCVYRTVKTEGILAIYKGFFAHLARILPHTILTLTFSESTYKLVRGVERSMFGIGVDTA